MNSSMESTEVLKILSKIHISYDGNCKECPLDFRNTKCGETLCAFSFLGENAEEVIEICEQWRKDHPIKTYADMFFEQFPNAERYDRDNRVPTIAFTDIYGGTFSGANNNVELWLQPYPEDKK